MHRIFPRAQFSHVLTCPALDAIVRMQYESRRQWGCTLKGRGIGKVEEDKDKDAGTGTDTDTDFRQRHVLA